MHSTKLIITPNASHARSHMVPAAVGLSIPPQNTLCTVTNSAKRLKNSSRQCYDTQRLQAGTEARSLRWAAESCDRRKTVRVHCLPHVHHSQLISCRLSPHTLNCKYTYALKRLTSMVPPLACRACTPEPPWHIIPASSCCRDFHMHGALTSTHVLHSSSPCHIISHLLSPCSGLQRLPAARRMLCGLRLRAAGCHDQHLVLQTLSCSAGQPAPRADAADRLSHAAIAKQPLAMQTFSCSSGGEPALGLRMRLVLRKERGRVRAVQVDVVQVGLHAGKSRLHLRLFEMQANPKLAPLGRHLAKKASIEQVPKLICPTACTAKCGSPLSLATSAMQLPSEKVPPGANHCSLRRKGWCLSHRRMQASS